LVKKIVFKDDESTSEAVKIDWKEGKDPSKKRKKGDDDEPLESFFSWFDDEDAQLSEIFAEKIFPEAIRQVELTFDSTTSSILVGPTVFNTILTR